MDEPSATAAPPGGDRLRVLLCGAIGPEKGFDVLLGCAWEATRAARALEFVLVGHSSDDARLIKAGVFVTGRFGEEEAVALLRRQGGGLGFLPSVWPETWCYALSALWAAGLPVIGFDLGAQAERIRRSGHGTVLPLGLDAVRINMALLAAGGRLAASQGGMMPGS